MTAAVIEIDRQISVLEGRRIDLDHKMKPDYYAPFDGDAMAALAILTAELAALHRKRSRALAGVEEPAPPTPAARLPRRMSDPAAAPSPLPSWLPTVGQEVKEKIIEETTALLGAIIRDVEDDVEDWQSEFPNNHEVRLTQGAYQALIGELVKLKGDIRILGRVVDVLAGDLQRRVDGLEKKQKGAGSSDELASISAHLQQLETKVRKVTGISDFEERLAELEARPVFDYRGVWEAREYIPGQLVTHHGSMWFCKSTTRSQPPSAEWQLCVKSGRPGKDAI